MNSSFIILSPGIRTGTIYPIHNYNPFTLLRRVNNILTISYNTNASIKLQWIVNSGLSTEIWVSYNEGGWNLLTTVNSPLTQYTHTIDLCLYNSVEYKIRTKHSFNCSSFGPIKKITIGPNLITNCGYIDATDFVDSNSDGLADNLISQGAALVPTIIAGGSDGFAAGNVQQITVPSATSFIYCNVLKPFTNYVTKYKWRATGGSGAQFGFGPNIPVNLDGYVYFKNTGDAVYRSYIIQTGTALYASYLGWQFYNTIFYLDEWELHTITVN